MGGIHLTSFIVLFDIQKIENVCVCVCVYMSVRLCACVCVLCIMLQLKGFLYPTVA